MRRRRSLPRKPEIDALLARYETLDGLDGFELAALEAAGFGRNLRPTRKRGPKLTAEMKAFLLLRELAYREWDAEADLSDDSDHDSSLSLRLLGTAEYEGERAFRVRHLDGGTAWRAWRERNPGAYAAAVACRYRCR